MLLKNSSSKLHLMSTYTLEYVRSNTSMFLKQKLNSYFPNSRQIVINYLKILEIFCSRQSYCRTHLNLLRHKQTLIEKSV